MSLVGDGDGLKWYTDHFDQHVRATIRHQDGLGRSDPSKRPHPPSMPGWTVDTASSFFAAVSRHSRLRTDLIASEVDQPESEVIAYLDALDEGLAKVIKTVESGTDGDRAVQRRLKHRRIFEQGKAHSAREVSQGWIRKEEELASMVNELVRQRDTADKELERAKRKKVERSTIVREVKTNIQDRVERKRVKIEKLSQLDNDWASEEWGQSLDRTKLLQLNKLTQPSWSEWYSRRIHNKHPNPSTEPPSDHDAGSALPDMGTREVSTTGKLSRHAKIAVDNATLQSLLSIDKPDRSREQRSEITKLQNRKRNRDNVRLDKLRRQGLSDADIEAKGGIDAAFLLSVGKSLEDESPSVSRLQTPVGSRHASPERQVMSPRPDRSRTSFTGTTTSEEGAAVRDLRRIGIDRGVHDTSLDIINFQQLAALSATVDTSLLHLNEVNHKMKTFLKKLLLSAIVIAEAERTLRGNGVELGVEHVHAAMEISSTARFGINDQRSTEDVSLLDQSDSDDNHDHEMTDEEDYELDVHLDALDEAMDEDLELRLSRFMNHSSTSSHGPRRDPHKVQEGTCNYLTTRLTQAKY